MIVWLILLGLLLILAYAWLGYPLLLAAAARRGRRVPATASGPTAAPRLQSVAMLLSAYNEEAHLDARLANLAQTAADLRAGGLDVSIGVGLDGCSDRTAAIARAWSAREPGIRVHEVAENRGKIRMLKDLAAAAAADVLLFTDANTHFPPGAVASLLAPFRDPAVGGVCGRLVFLEPGGAPADEGFYWRWETRLKALESTVDSCLGANGAIYAIRRECFWRDVPDNTIVDDFVIGMKVREQGFRMLYAPEAVAEEDLPHIAAEWRRRVRIGAGDFQALWLCRHCLRPRFGAFAWMFASHKVLRWLTPHLLLALAAGSLWPGVNGWARGIAVLGAAAALGCTLAGRRLRAAGLADRRWARFPCLCEHFFSMQAALFVGSLRFLRGNLKGHWQRTPRADAPPEK